MQIENDLLGYPRLKIIQDPDMFAFSIDSMLLGDFVKIKKNTKRIMDLCTGNAAIPLYLSVKTKAEIHGVEIQEKVYEMAAKGVLINHLENQIHLYHQDLKGISKNVGKLSFDIVTANPPFFKVPNEPHLNKNEYLSIARHEVMLTLEELIIEAHALLNNGGSFYLVHRPDRLTDILSLLRKHDLEPKRLRLVQPRRNTKPNHVLIEAVKNRLEGGLIVETPLVVYHKDNWTKAILDIYNIGRESYVTQSIES